MNGYKLAFHRQAEYTTLNTYADNIDDELLDQTLRVCILASR
jgi:hypothetical protein